MCTYEIIDVQQNSTPWLSWRRGKIGASDAPAIMGVSRNKTALDLWEEIVHGKSTKDNPAMQRGKTNEPVARNAFNFQRGCYYEPVCMQSTLYPWMIASLDGWMKTPKHGLPRIMEIKTPGIDDHNLALSGKVPDCYYPQLQHQMVVEGERQALYLSSRDEQEAIVILDRDDKYCEDLVRKEQEFYDSLVSFKAPEPTEKDFIDINKDSTKIIARNYKAVNSKIDELLKEKEELKAALIKEVGHPRARVGDLIIRRDFVEGRIDYKNIEILKTIDTEKYRKPGSFQWKVFT